MIAISAADAFWPAMDAARSPDSLVRTKLTTRTVRPTSAAKHSLRNMNNSIVGSYENEAGRAPSRCSVICGRHPNPTASLAYSQHAPHSTSSDDDGQDRRTAQAPSPRLAGIDDPAWKPAIVCARAQGNQRVFQRFFHLGEAEWAPRL